MINFLLILLCCLILITVTSPPEPLPPPPPPPQLVIPQQGRQVCFFLAPGQPIPTGPFRVQITNPSQTVATVAPQAASQTVATVAPQGCMPADFYSEYAQNGPDRFSQPFAPPPQPAPFGQMLQMPMQIGQEVPPEPFEPRYYPFQMRSDMSQGNGDFR